MDYKALINIMPKKELLDPQGKTVLNNLKNIDVYAVDDVRIGKRVELTFSAENEEKANEKVEIACKKLLANGIMENYSYSLETI